MNVRLDEAIRRRLALLPRSAAGLDAARLLRRDGIALGPPLAPISPNGHCRLLRTLDGWVALNLARPEDRELLPALTCQPVSGWTEAERAAATMHSRDFVGRACELQLPAARPGEAMPARLATTRGAAPRRVVDLSALWAGPLCGSLLARAGAEVVRVESLSRPDPTPLASPALDRFLNGGKRRCAVDLSTPSGRATLRDEIRRSDALVTSARQQALRRLGLDPETLLGEQPGLTWIAITAHGWEEDRVGFGDDCAVAGGLVSQGPQGPGFLGDALADPLTGLEAALACCERSGGLIDMAMAPVAAAYAAWLDR